MSDVEENVRRTVFAEFLSALSVQRRSFPFLRRRIELELVEEGGDAGAAWSHRGNSEEHGRFGLGGCCHRLKVLRSNDFGGCVGLDRLG